MGNFLWASPEICLKFDTLEEQMKLGATHLPNPISSYMFGIIGANLGKFSPLAPASKHAPRSLYEIIFREQLYEPEYRAQGVNNKVIIAQLVFKANYASFSLAQQKFNKPA
jgi:hypothetical protein